MNIDWNDIKTRAKREDVSPSMIMREEIQKAILTSFSQERLFQNIVLKGGTALRLFYENPRFSEDLDFVVREGRQRVELDRYLNKTTNFISNSYPYLEDVESFPQKKDDDFQRFVVKTSSNISEQKLRINVKLFAVPSYENEINILSYPPINPAVRVERLVEILADKTVALSARNYIKGRDLWDIYLLWYQKGVELSGSLVEKKVKDYKVEKFISDLKETDDRLAEVGEVILKNELKRFLSPSLYSNYKEEFKSIVDIVRKFIKKVMDRI
ncbi:MAG: nucleotidyl transferase AbiEii/AbiGii toxin family protein [Thermoplasmatota archaeon]